MGGEPLGGARPRRQPARRWARKLAWVLVPMAIVGEAGHHLLERLGQTLAHHAFHVIFTGAAVAIFLGYVVRDVRRHGRPTLSWRLRPGRAGPRGGTASRTVSRPA